MEIGIVAPINWTNPGIPIDGVDYMKQIKNIASFNDDLNFFILNFESIKEDGDVIFYDINKNEIGNGKIEDFCLIHFLDFEPSNNISESLVQKWHRINSKLKQFEEKKILTINSVKLINYCFEKKYLTEIKDDEVNFIQTRILKSGTNFEKIKQEYRNGSFIIKPLNGESGNYVFEIESISIENYLKMCDQSENLIIQPFRKEVQNGEYSMLFFREKYCHAIVRTPVNIKKLLPPKFNITKYIPSTKEIEVGNKIFSLFPEKLDIFRVDFIKAKKEILIMEVESVDPFHYVIENFREYSEKIGAFYKMILN
ncbi:MAG: hypothetical protein HXX09_10680 [Bacteroidetes bacterium]|nr:hypothetical protein [Bacteroidota bacterium]